MLKIISMMGAVPLGRRWAGCGPARYSLPGKGGTLMMKRLFALIPVLLFCLTMLPTTALAAETNTVYVGGVALTGSSGSIVYATTNENGEVITEGATADNYNIKWDGSTLTLHDATIQKELYASDLPLSNIAGAAIGVINQSGDAGLTVQLEGNNKIEGVSTGIHVRSSGGNAALNITGNGTLVVNSNYPTIQVTSIGGNAALSIENAKVTATSSYSNVVTVQSGNSENSSASLTVDGGSLTATAPSNNVSGIRFVFGSGGSGSGTPTVTVSGNAIVRANGSAGGITSNSSTEVHTAAGTGESGGIVFDNGTGTVYGDVTLQEDITIGEGESLTIGDGASLNTGSHAVNVNGGTLIGGDKITGTVKYAPVITTESLPGGTVGTAYSQALAADGTAPISWSVTSGALPAGLTLSSDGKITGTPTTAGESKFTVTATNASGSASKAFTITVNYQPTTITTQPQNVAVTVGQPAAFTVAATGSNLAYQWQQSTDGGKTWTDITGATGENYTTAATTMSMNGCQYRCVVKGDGGEVVSNAATLTVNPVPVTSVTLDKNTLALFTGESDALTATVAPENATDKTVTWTSDNEKVATVNGGTVTAVAPGIANITATTTDGSFTATCAVTVTDKTYTISVGPGNLDFGTVYLGYAQPAAQTVTVTSTGNQKVTVALPTATNFIITAGEGFADGSAVIEPGKTAAFTVQPKQGLTVGRYAETLTVTSAEGGKVELPVTFTVNPVPVTGVTLDKKTLSLFTGDSATLTATVAPENATDKTVTWVSSNPAIVTVDGSGHVKAVAAGTANITVTTTDGNKTAVCAVTVTGRTYTLSSDPSAIAFGNVYTGYNPPAAQVVVVKNTGNQSLNLTQPTATNFGVGKLSQTALKPGETATFIVQPKAGLGEGSYKETLTISGDGGAKATVNLSFVVQASPAATATPAPTPLEMHTLHFDTNGGLPMDDVKFGLGAPVELWPYTPVRAGYLFQGWYSDQALTKAVGTIVLVKDTTIYAKWAPDPAAAASSGSSGSGSGSGSSGSSGGNKGGTTITVTPAPTATATPTPTPTVTPTPEPTATPEATLPPEETDKGSFPVVPVAAGAIILLVLVGGIVIFRRFRD